MTLCPSLRNRPGTPKVDASKVHAMIWRFFPSLDPQVDILMSRDLDSRLSRRELAAVEEWLTSGAPVHVMRDSPDHAASMLGGMWGARMEDDNIRRLWAGHWDRMLEDKLAFASREVKGPDQNILDKYVWPWARYIALSHDSYQ